MKLKIVLAALLASVTSGFCDGWSESGVAAPVAVEYIICKDDGAVLVKFSGSTKYYYFALANHQGMLSTLLSAKTSGALVRVYTTTNNGYYSLSGSVPYQGPETSAYYLGAVQIQ